jgi:hypothetical protein
MKRLLPFLLLSLGLTAQTATRTVTINAANTNPAGSVLGMTVSVGTAAAGPFTPLGCLGTVTGAPGFSAITCTAGTIGASATFTDPSETVGSTVYYSLQFIGTACTSGQTTACGNSTATVTAAVPIPPRDTAPGSITVIVIN